MFVRAVVAAGVCLVVACTGGPPITPEPSPAATPSPTPPAVPTATPTMTELPTPSPSPTGGAYAGTDWTATALDLGPVGATFLFDCPAGGAIGVIWGTDVYTADSSVCTAAVHAGVIDTATGGDVTIEIRSGESAYEGSTRNGVTSVGYPSYDSSFVIVGAPLPEPSPSASPAAGEDFGPFTELVRDDFSDPTSGWGTGLLDVGTIEYGASGVLEVSVTEANRALRSTYRLPSGWNVLRVEGLLTPQAGSGIFGLMCAASLNDMTGALVASSGAVIFVELSGESVRVLQRDDTAGVAVAAGIPLAMAVECAGTATGAARLRLEVDGALVGTYDGGQEGPSTFSQVAVYGEATGDEFAVNLDDLVVGGATGENLPPPPTTGPADVAGLLAHVPPDFRDRCQETPTSAFDVGALVAVACSVQSGPGAEIIEYVQFDTLESMNAAYQRRVQAWGADANGTSCQAGPAEISYTVDQQPAGRLLCAPQTGGIRFDWTDERLNILTTATDFDSSYADLYQDWLEAGPDL